MKSAVKAARRIQLITRGHRRDPVPAEGWAQRVRSSESVTSLADDAAATRRILAMQDGPTVLVATPLQAPSLANGERQQRRSEVGWIFLAQRDSISQRFRRRHRSGWSASSLCRPRAGDQRVANRKDFRRSLEN
jgi:hypothetical protein